jgi:DnaJ-class molecular chaperone
MRGEEPGLVLDPYSILGVSRSASEADIKKAFRAKAKTLHPDQHPGDKAKEEEFKRLNGAFEILGDPEKRAKFDRGEIDGDGNPKGFGGGGFTGGGRWEGGAGAQGDPFEDILSGMFGSGARRRNPGPQKGRDVRYRVEIAFEDAVTGARRRMAMADGSALDVNIPAGMISGQTLRLKSQGQPSPSGGPPGDALLEVDVLPSTIWTREGKDLRMSLSVDLRTAITGGTVDVRTPSGPVSLKIPAGTNTGAQLRLKGKGVQVVPPGDLYVRIEIVLSDPRDDGLRRWAEGR